MRVLRFLAPSIVVATALLMAACSTTPTTRYDVCRNWTSDWACTEWGPHEPSLTSWLGDHGWRVGVVAIVLAAAALLMSIRARRPTPPNAD